jgi:hypothetical protein
VVTHFERFADQLNKLLNLRGWAIGLTALLLFAIFYGDLSVDPDLFARVAAGRLVATSGVAAQDPFAFTQTKPIWVDHEWLSGYFFYQIAHTFGDFGLFLFKALCAALSMAILFSAAKFRQQKAPSIFWLIVIAWACSYVWVSTVRSQVLTYLCLPIFLWTFAAFEKFRRGTILIILPLAMLPWANAHGGFVVGLGLLLLFGLSLLPSDRVAALKVLFVFGISVLITSFNPYGFSAYWQYLLDALSLQRSTISEWAPIDLLSVPAIFPACLALLVFWGAWLGRKQVDLVALLLIGSSAFFGFRHNRLIAIFYMTTFVFGGNFLWAGLSRVAQNPLWTKLRRVSALLAAIAGLWSVCLLLLFVSHWSKFSLDRSAYPEKALSWLKDNRAGGKLLIDFNNGSFGLFRLYPRFQISVDGRYEEVYPEDTVRLVSDALDPASPSQASSLVKVNPDFALITAVLSSKFEQGSRPDWSKKYCDERFCIFERKDFEPNKNAKVRTLVPSGIPWAMDF